VDVIPGHGDPFKGKERVDWFQAYLRDLWKQGSALHEQKVSAADAAKRIDMTAHKAHYPAITGPGLNPAWVSRLYEVIEGRADLAVRTTLCRSPQAPCRRSDIWPQPQLRLLSCGSSVPWRSTP
jgi:hypothetical protein